MPRGLLLAVPGPDQLAVGVLLLAVTVLHLLLGQPADTPLHTAQLAGSGRGAETLHAETTGGGQA